LSRSGESVSSTFQLPRFRADAAFTSWLWRIAANQCMDHLRKQAARPLDLLEELPDQSDGGRNRSLTETELDAHRLLALLAPEERMVVLLRLFADLEFEEIASALEIGTSAAKMRYQRALQRLRETVAPGAVSAGCKSTAKKRWVGGFLLRNGSVNGIPIAGLRAIERIGVGPLVQRFRQPH